MSTPKVTEITRRPQPVARDTFIDDLPVLRGPDSPRTTRASRRAVAPRERGTG
jgi:hypothetical protein